jgi:hypothetical protein
LINFLAETEYAILLSFHTIEDIHYISSHIKNYISDWNTFAKLSNFEYNNTYLYPIICSDMKIVFTDGTYLKRTISDMYEYWIFVRYPSINNKKVLTHKKMLLN